MYQPALRPDQIKPLYYLKLQRHRPMTVLVREELPNLHLLITEGWYHFTGVLIGGFFGGLAGLVGGLGGSVLGAVKGSAAGGAASWAWNKTTQANSKMVRKIREHLEVPLSPVELEAYQQKIKRVYGGLDELLTPEG